MSAIHYPEPDPELERETTLDAEASSPETAAAVAPPPPAPAPVHPEADRGTSDGTLLCTVCLRPVAAGETYVKTAVRGINHLEPCSHRS